MPTSEEAAAAAATTLVEGTEAEETQSGSEETQTEETTPELPNFDIDLPADLAALLDEDDPTDYTVTDEELDSLAEENEEVPREILARMRAAEKRAEHLEKLRVTEAKKNWAEEAAKYFPLAEPFLTEINATSKRGYLRTAREVHEKMKPIFEKSVAQFKDATEATKEQAKTEGKEEAKKAWGQAGESHEAPSEAQVMLQATQDRRRKGELSDTIRNMLFPKEA